MNKRVKGFAGLLAALRADLPKLRDRVVAGATVAAHETLPVVAANIPKAFGELERSLAVETTRKGVMLVAKAPHAEPVESGTRPHVVPIEPLVRWVVLRRLAGPNDKPESIAKAIQLKIAAEGTPPHWYMRRALPAAHAALASAVPKAIK